MTTKTIYVPQPDPSSCQSACLAMVLRTTDVPGIHAELELIGDPGDPTVMDDYIALRVKSYKFLLSGSLNDAKKALDDGCVVITHGWFTVPGHVILLIGYEPDPATLSHRFIVHDPWAEYDFSNGGYDDSSKTGESVRYSSLGIYATCVDSFDYEQACEIYRQKTFKSDEQNAWLHIIQN